MSSKSLVNAPEDVVTEAIEGFLMGQPTLTRLDGLPDIKVVLRADWDKSKVALISGGGSGHEPAHVGFVGAGMLTAAVCGNVFASPSVAAVLAAIRAVGGPKGVVLIVKNYTGDRLNFGLAASIARTEGIPVNVVFVADDAALDTGKITGRRGVAGTVFVHKVAGAVAESGASLEDVTAAATAAADSVASMGVSLSVCTVPHTPHNPRLDNPAEMEIGLGIHGEPGSSKTDHIPPAKEVADIMVKQALSMDRMAGVKNAAVLVNNLGGLSALELSILTRDIVGVLSAAGVTTSRLYTGPLMTALDMKGLSVSILPVDDSRLAHLDLPVSCVGWPNSSAVPDPAARPPAVAVPSDPTDADESKTDGEPNPEAADAVKRSVLAACDAVKGVVDLLTELDTAVGDGDCGRTFEAGANRVVAAVESGDLDTSTPRKFFKSLGRLLRLAMGGTSGVILDIHCAAAEASFRGKSVEEQFTVKAWSEAFGAAVADAVHYGNAKVGFATMMDALIPASEAAKTESAGASSAAALASAIATAARAGAEATASMTAGAGRASYLADSATAGVRDPGAVAMATILEAVAEALK